MMLSHSPPGFCSDLYVLKCVRTEVESGQPMLAQAAQKNVKTWQFEQHSPTTFEVTFRYRLLKSKITTQGMYNSVKIPPTDWKEFITGGIHEMQRDIPIYNSQ